MHQKETNTNRPKKLLFIYVTVVVALFLIFRDKIQEIAPTLQLTPDDLRMIPIGALIFIIFWQVSERFLFGPYLKLYEAREAATSGSLDESKKLIEKAESISNDVAAELFQSRSRLSKERELILSTTKAACDLELSNTNAALQSKLETERSKNTKTVAELKSSLDQQVNELTRDVVERIKTGAVASRREVQ